MLPGSVKFSMRGKPWIGALFGGMDMGIGFAFAAHINPPVYYAVVLVIKTVVAGIYARSPSPRADLENLSFISLLLLSAFVGAQNLAVVPTDGLQLLGFCLQLILTGNTLEAEDVPVYCRAVTIALFASLLLYLEQVATGKVEVSLGLRFSFLGDTHPNLGGELILSGLFIAGICCPAYLFLLLSVFTYLPLFLLQARSAMIDVFFLQAVCLFYLYTDWRSAGGKLVILVLAGMTGLALTGQIYDVLDAALHLSDKSRGVDSGFSGRSDLWEFAWDAFKDAPLLGQGYGFYDALGSIGAHNLYLFIFSQNGLVGLAILAWMFNGVLKLGRVREVIWFSSFFFMAVFNDRFANLNPYPFLYYVMMWLPGRFITIRCLHRNTQGSQVRNGVQQLKAAHA